MAIKTLRGNGTNTLDKQVNQNTNLWKRVRVNYMLYLFVLPAMAYYFIFHYIPIYGVQIAFKDFSAVKGIIGSPWAGITHFRRFFTSYHFWTLLKNTIGISIYQLVAGFPAPIILALMLNYVRHSRFKRFVQTVTYAPHFISTVVMVGMLLIFLSPRNGIVNIVLQAFGLQPIFFFAEPTWFKSLYVWSNVWQNAGWGSIIYIATLAGISPELYEAATVDGASKFQRILYIDIPSIIPTATILLILNLGRIMSVGFEKVFLMQNSLNLESSEIIATYVYKTGLLGAQFSFSSAIGLFNNAINFVLLILVNNFARRFSSTSLW